MKPESKTNCGSRWMPHYRLSTNGHKFRAEVWRWFWPFWSYIKGRQGPEGSIFVWEWDNQKDAEKWIRGQIVDDNRHIAKWKVIE